MTGRHSSVQSIPVIATVCVAFVFTACARDRDTRLAVDAQGRTVVERYGQLQVIGTDLCDSNGNPVQLRGMSSHGLQWFGRFANTKVLRWLRDDWNSQVWRAALYLVQGGYIQNPALKERVIASVEAAVENGKYVIVDWHVLRDRNPQVYKARALEFFAYIAKRYGHLPNLLYEICNEPNGEDVTWAEDVKPYAEELIAEIRKYDPDNIIIVGTPTWSQDVDIAARDPITTDPNIMYAVHFYAGSHGQSLKDKISQANKLGAPLFATEWGTTTYTGGGGVFEKETLEWLSFLKKYNISWVNWSVNNKGEDSGILNFNADRFAEGNWKESDLSRSGIFVRKILRNEIKVR